MKNLALTVAVLACMTAPAFAQDKDTTREAEYCFKQADTNGDGSLSKSEWDAYGNKMFADTDSNKDNAITLDEHKNAMTKHMRDMKNWIDSTK